MIHTDTRGFGTLIGIIIVAVVIAVIAAGSYYALGDDSEPESELRDDTASSPQVDVQLKNDLQRIMSFIENYAADNNGRYPATNTDIDEFEANYFPSDFTHPENDLPYTVNQLKGDGYHLVTYRTGQCGSDGSIELSDSTRQYALQVELTDGELHCADNS